MGIKFKVKGSFYKTNKFFDMILRAVRNTDFDKYGRAGVDALRAATPVRSGLTADSWDYKIERGGEQTRIIWFNTNENQGVNIAVILQYGHGTRNGGYVKGIDYINPAMQPIFEEISQKAWNEITKGV